ETGYKTDAEKEDGCLEWESRKWEKNKEVTWKNTDFEQSEKHPVVCVSWNDANEYIKWVNSRAMRKFRLPTEAEWEYTARSGGKDYEYVWGFGWPNGNIADETAKKRFPKWTVWEGYDDGYVFTAPVGSFKANELGVYDLEGNVWEWIFDWYKGNYYKSSPKDNPQGPDTGERRVVRGGTWLNKYSFSRTTHRFKETQGKRYVNGGFRLAYSAE
ncbi:MAG: SUMF1/EgtB/PvdO family nonheme iron enzyme, partial [Nitrospirae bacterium]|nr:SUMF1/EgtB/PvdO family nonheme iron enzyme [Nitrospirota bacterium]